MVQNTNFIFVNVFNSCFIWFQGGSCDEEDGCGYIYVGIFNIVQTFQSSQSSQKYSDMEYSYKDECPSTIDLCRGCDFSMKVLLSLEVINLLLCLFDIHINISRLTDDGNTRRNKWLGIMTSFGVVILSFASLGLMGLRCGYAVVEYYIDIGVDPLKWRPGPSLMWVCCSFTVFINCFYVRFVFKDCSSWSSCWSWLKDLEACVCQSVEKCVSWHCLLTWRTPQCGMRRKARRIWICEVWMWYVADFEGKFRESVCMSVEHCCILMMF
jgi:hypothetical protein